MRAVCAGRFARRAAASGPGVVCAVFRRSFYTRHPGGYACVGDASLGRGPLNILVDGFEAAALHARLRLDLTDSEEWAPQSPATYRPRVETLEEAANPPEEGFGGLIVGRQSALAAHAAPALAALAAWLRGHALAQPAAGLIGLGPGLTPSGDDYLAGVLVALRAAGRGARADALWRWLEPRLAGRTSALSAAHLAAAAAGEAHEALHACLARLVGGAAEWAPLLARLGAVGHCSGWDALAGAHAALRGR